MNRYRLYGTSACHLCEQAEAMLETLRERGIAVDYDKVDISESDQLFQRYGLLIPVVRDPQGRELLWPFDAAELVRFIARE